ncbi:AMP-binding protein [Coprobacter tertius]|uniref:AMP-binding protein n=1 Tax=Coprobacter tertius TaxID=2944915 RepID=A0ABT1MHI3_9BACT|nr:AMP-binding protein [Coprobacter tertius]MCP9612087.1 AMP-binding protein [Coprobacter tertius]
MQTSFNRYIENAIIENWERIALSDFNGVSYSYKDIARKIAKLHILLEASGIKKGDKVAICGRNSSHWAVSFFATLTYGAVAVPILHEFKADNVHHIVNHSDAKVLFVGDVVWENLNDQQMPDLNAIILINDFSVLKTDKKELITAREHLNEFFGKKYPSRFTKEDVKYHEDSLDELALINYTSGSTGFSKGVMLSYRSIWSNLKFCNENLDFLQAGDGTVSMLPMAHMYGLAIELMNPFAKGCHIHFLTRVPSPKVIMDAFAEIKPKMIVAVPLIIEKIIKTKVFPLLEKPIMRLMMMVPFLDTQLLSKIKNKLTETFGGNLQELIIGGAALNKEVEDFLRKIEFPFTVGYGMTECGPLISYAPWTETRLTSCGKVVQRMKAKIESADPQNIVGELWVKGDNVMLGYYKNDEATHQVLKKDGWMNTGDLALLDKDNYIYLKGRSKSMILGPSGQNIYPEEIEGKLNNMPYVNESVVIDKDGKLVALIYPDFDNAEKEGITKDKIEDQMEENRIVINKELPAYSQISQIKIFYEEFEKTPKRSIKRYLYQNT